MAIRLLPRILSSTLHHPPSPLPPFLLKIQSFSNLTKPTQFTQQITLSSLLKRYGFPQSQLLQFINQNPFLSKSQSSDIETCIRTLLSFNLTQNSLISVLLNCPKSLQLGFLDQWVLTLSELGFSAIPSSSLISTVLEQSGRFRIDPNEFRRNALTMKKDLGFRNETVIRVFEELPAAFISDPVDVGRRVEVLIDYGFDKENIDRICFEFPELLAFDVDGRLRLLFQEFDGLRFSRNEVRSVIVEDAKLVLGMEVGEISRCVDLITSLKCRVPIKDRIVGGANGRRRRFSFRAGIVVKLRIDLLCKYGLIRRDAFKVLYVEPRSILYELEDIEKKIDFLLHTMGFTIEHLVEFPDYLGVNFEKHILPRFSVIQHLRSRGGLGFQVGLKHLVRFSRLKFYNFFVKPYPECVEIFGGLIREEVPKVVRPRHPPGLWKMFKPDKFPETEKDVVNMKLFVESLV